MIDKLARTGQQLNQTFVPKDLIKKTDSKNLNTLTTKNVFQKTMGNIYIEIEPPEIKFNGYELDKAVTATVKIINKAPIPQRVHILPPQLQTFSIKVNKKGPIPSGMSENIQITFKSSEFKYQYDVIKINTETQNFVIPVYAYPTIPGLRNLFPKLIDFGLVEVKQSTSNIYPIVNPVPIDFQFQFLYEKECNQIMITPLRGIIPKSSTLNVEIAFAPMYKCTSTSEVHFRIKQFDFEPIVLKIIGTGKQASKLGGTNFKRIKSSKLTPLNSKDQKNQIDGIEDEKRKTANFSNKNISIQTPGLNATGNISVKKTSLIRTSFPKLLNNTKKTVVVEEQAKTLNPKSISQREYLSRFTRMQEMDKEKDIKFSEYLGDRALNESEIEFQKQVVRQSQTSRMNLMQDTCLARYNPEISGNVEVEFKTFKPREVTWDDKKNDQLANRRVSLIRFMKAGSQVIIKYRLLKRLQKIKEFLKDCHNNKDEVRKKVEENYAKAMDSKGGNALRANIQFDFSFDNLRPSFFEIQFNSTAQLNATKEFKPTGKPQFDDLCEIKPLQAHNVEIFKFTETVFPPDFVNISKIIPPNRFSGEQEYSLRTAVVPGYQPIAPSNVYSLPLKIPTHHFIYNDQKLRRYKSYNQVDEKDIQYLFNCSDNPIQDQFQGWTGGEHEVLRAKFMRNTGCQYQTFNSFNASTSRHDLGFLGKIADHLPNTLEQVQKQDLIDEGDSDQEGLPVNQKQEVSKLLEKIEGSHLELKQRREKKIVKNPERQYRKNIDKNLQTLKIKSTSEHITKMRQFNKFVEKTQYRFLF